MPRERTDYRVVHGSWTPPHLDVGAEEIDQWHRERGWSGIGYHYVIRRNGTLEEGRGLVDAGAHVKGYNSISIGYCLMGGAPADLYAEDQARKAEWDGVPETKKWHFNYTRPQLSMLLLILQQHGKLWPESEVIGHGDFPGVTKGCPGFNVSEWYGEGDAEAP